MLVGKENDFHVSNQVPQFLFQGYCSKVSVPRFLFQCLDLEIYTIKNV
jgi:hypothetical protein